MIKLRSKLSYFFIPKGVEYAFYPNIYVEQEIYDNLNWFQDILAHEEKHLAQQSTYKYGKFAWLAKYYFSKKFRLDQEAQAYAISLKYTDNFNEDLSYYSNILSGKLYRYCCGPTEARFAILRYYNELS